MTAIANLIKEINGYIYSTFQNFNLLRACGRP